jgi:hypothetical protein
MKTFEQMRSAVVRRTTDGKSADIEIDAVGQVKGEVIIAPVTGTHQRRRSASAVECSARERLSSRSGANGMLDLNRRRAMQRVPSR